MATAWPTADAPFKILLDSFGEELEDNRYRFKPEIGPAIMRRKGSIRTDQMRGAALWTLTQYQAALDFYTDDLEDGTLPFTATHPRTGLTTTFQFVRPMSYSPSGLHLRVSLDLEILS